MNSGNLPLLPPHLHRDKASYNTALMLVLCLQLKIQSDDGQTDICIYRRVVKLKIIYLSTTIELCFVLPCSPSQICKIWKYSVNTVCCFYTFIKINFKIWKYSVNTVWWIYTFIKILILMIYG